MVVADPGGKRIGGGGSTLHCLMKVLNQGVSLKKRKCLSKETWKRIDLIRKGRYRPEACGLEQL